MFGRRTFIQTYDSHGTYCPVGTCFDVIDGPYTVRSQGRVWVCEYLKLNRKTGEPEKRTFRISDRVLRERSVVDIPGKVKLFVCDKWQEPAQ